METEDYFFKVSACGFFVDLIGVIVYFHSYLNLKSRNMILGERYVFTLGDLHKARLVNEKIARISRVIIHPK